jgi:phage/plasmid-like protein (TIGR03299 family)
MSKTTSQKVKGLHNWQQNYEKSSLNWEVEKRPLFNREGKQTPLFELVRSDNKHYLGNGTDSYEIIQNKRLFQFGHDLEKDIPGISFDSAGYLRDGRGVFVKFGLPFSFDVGGVGDVIETYLMLSTSHGGGALTFGAETLRLICTNGMTAIKRHSLFNVRHTVGAENKIAMNSQIVKNVSTDLENFGTTMDILAKTQLDVSTVGNIIEKVFDDGEDSNIYTSSVKQNKARAILNIFEQNDGDTFKKQRGTAYSLLQSFSNYTDHNANYKINDGETEAQARIRGAVFGVGQTLKMRALQEISLVVSKNGVELPEMKF